MATEYRPVSRPLWIWIMLGVAAILVILLALSVAASRSREEVVVIGPSVRTGNPADHVRRPPTPPTTTPAPTPTPPPPPGQLPAGMPQSFTYGGRTWAPSGGPVQVDVLTTGQLTDDHVIYSRAGDTPPYGALYIETTPNSGQFYRYVPAQG